jgi:hypothetical protein
MIGKLDCGDMHAVELSKDWIDVRGIISNAFRLI